MDSIGDGYWTHGSDHKRILLQRNDSAVCLPCLLVTLVSRNLLFTSATKSSSDQIHSMILHCDWQLGGLTALFTVIIGYCDYLGTIHKV